METEEILDLQQSVNATPIYSQQVVRVFGILMSALFGGILLYQNLKDIGKEKESNQVFLISFGFTVGAVLLFGISGATLGINVAGAYVIATYMDKTIPGHKQMPKKKICKPLIIALLLLVLIFAIIFMMVA